MKFAKAALSLSLALLALPAIAQTDGTGPPEGASAGDAPHYQFRAATVTTLLSTEYVVDFIDSAGKTTHVVEIPKGTRTLSPLDRAATIAKRLMDASVADRDFWDKLDSRAVHSQTVVAISSDDEGFVMTADAPSAAVAGCASPDQYALVLLKRIKNALRGKIRDAKFDYELTSDEDKLVRANDYRRQAEEAYAAKDFDRTENLYRQAIRVVPTYAAAYLALGQFYVAHGEPDKARGILKQAQDNHLDLLATNKLIDPSGAPDAIKLVKQMQTGG